MNIKQLSVNYLTYLYTYKVAGGKYGDPSAECQVFHICADKDELGTQLRFSTEIIFVETPTIDYVV